MAYRTYINGKQWLGNNILPDVIYEELKRQGCPFDEDCWVRKGFRVKDLDALVKATEKYITDMFLLDRSIADIGDTIDLEIKRNENGDGGNLTFELKNFQSNGYIFASANLLNFVGGKNYHIEYEYEDKKLILKYVLNEGAKCIFKAY